jgi:Xaa-Pro aminopeptidase
MKKRRIDGLLGLLDSLKLSGIIITDMKNVRYFSGFTGSDGAVVVGKKGGTFLTDGRYTTQAAGEVDGFEVVEYKSKAEGIADAVKRLKIRKVGVESHAVTLFLYDSIVAALPGKTVLPIQSDLARLRMVKDEAELAAIAEAIRIAEDSLSGIERLIAAGTREEEIAVELEYRMKRAGSGTLPFPIIVASGPNGALPHAHGGPRKIKAGDLVTIDFGAQYRGYHSDETVTVMVGRDGKKQREVYEIVLGAQRNGIAAVRAGVSVREVDEAARGYIRERGYGDYFSHGTGHGVGLDIHEPPRVSFLADDVLEAGMVITIEPGIYIPGWGGVRIEDMVVVEQDGARLLTTIPKSFRVMP